MQEEYQALLKSEQFQSFITKHPQHYLVNVFILYSKQYAANWQFGFFDTDADLITAFIVKRSEDGTFVITQEAQDEAAKEPNAILSELDLTTVSIMADTALDTAITCCETEYNSDAAQSRILLLQNTKEYGVVWNVTVISTAFDVVNVKVDAQSGEIKAHSKHSLLDMNANRV